MRATVRELGNEASVYEHPDQIAATIRPRPELKYLFIFFFGQFLSSAQGMGTMRLCYNVSFAVLSYKYNHSLPSQEGHLENRKKMS